MFARHLLGPLRDALRDTPAAMVVGARQAGKTTLVRTVAEGLPRASYVTLDDLTALEAARG
jgi:predicted AAA+ superfamily ATPase